MTIERCTDLWGGHATARASLVRAVQSAPYFVLDGNICALLATKDHVNVFLYDPTVPDPENLINQGHGNATARAIQMYRADTVNTPALLALFRAVIANNRAGGWRRLERRTSGAVDAGIRRQIGDG